MKTNEDILKMHLRSDFDMLKDFGMLGRVLQAMNESNSESCLNYIKSADDRHYCIKCGARRKQEFMKIVEVKLHRTQWECLKCSKAPAINTGA